MKIGMVGYFGWGNFGDELFVKVYREYFSEEELIFFHDATQNRLLPNIEQLIDSVDAIVIGGGDLMIPWYKSWLYWDRRFLRKPIYIHGIGVPTWGAVDQKLLSYYGEFLSHPNVKFVSCRDIESVSWIKDNIRVDRDIYFYPDMVLTLDIPVSSERDNVVGIVIRKQDTYETKEIYKVSKFITDTDLRIRPIILSVGKSLEDDLKAIENFDFPTSEIVVRSNMDQLVDELGRCKFLISMKFHGIVVSYLLGVPFISLSNADKFVSFCKQINNEKYLSTWSDPRLVEKFRLLTENGMDFSARDDLIAHAKLGMAALRTAILNR